MLAIVRERTPLSESAESLPGTTLIICSRHRPKLLVESVASVLCGEIVPTELLIMDQSDTPHPTLSTLGPTRGCEIRYIRTQAIGESPAKNTALRLARYPIIVFTDDDVLVTPTWFGSLVRALLEAGPQTVVMGQVPPTQPDSPTGFAPTKKVGDEPAVYQGRVNEDVLCPINMAMYRDLFEAVGGFDERLGAGAPFPGAEDNDFGFRLLELGYRIVYAPHAVVYHRAWRQAGDYLPVRYTYGRGQGAFYAKHLSLRDPYILRRMAWDIWRHVRRLPGRIWWRDRTKGMGDIVYTLALLSGAIEWLLTQQRAD